MEINWKIQLSKFATGTTAWLSIFALILMIIHNI